MGIVNRSQADINRNVDMLSARRKEKEYFESSPEYGHLAHKMGAEYLAKLLSQVRAFCFCGMLLQYAFELHTLTAVVFAFVCSI